MAQRSQNKLVAALIAAGDASERDAGDWEREAGSESLAVWLVRTGTLDAETVADACARAFEIPRATSAMLGAVRPSVFQRIPIEILHDAGMLPLAMKDDHRLVVGAVDPNERARIDEAEFFAGVALELRVLSVAEMADGFERLAGRPWRVNAADLPVSRRRARRVAGRRERGAVPDVAPVVAGNAGEGRGASRVGRDSGPVLEVLPADGEAEFVLTPASRKEPSGESTTSYPELRFDSTDIELIESTEVEHVADDAAAAAASEVGEPKDVSDDTAGPWSSLSGDGADAGWRVSTGSSAVVSGVPRPSAASTERLRSLPEPPVQANPKRESWATPERPVRAAERRRATTGGVAIPSRASATTIPDSGRFGSASELYLEAGEPDAATEAAYHAAITGVAEARTRDDVARQLVDALSLVYPTSLVLSLRAPHMVVWDVQSLMGAPRLVGARFEIAEGSLWQRVTEEPSAYLGPLPAADPLRRLLMGACGDQTLLVPVTLNRRPVSVLVMMSGHGRALPVAGDAAEALARAVGKAFKRVILRTKREPHSV